MIKNLLYFAIFTTAVILSWIAFGVYHSFTTSTISTDAQILITPIPPNFDSATIGRVRQRKVVPVDLRKSRFDIQSTPTPIQSGPTPSGPQGIVSIASSESASIQPFPGDGTIPIVPTGL